MAETLELTGKVLAALHGIDGLRPATPVDPESAAWVPWDWAGLAVDLEPELVQVRLIATRLPLPPLLRAATEAIRPVLAGTPWEAATLRLVVTDIDGSAFAGR